MARRSHPSTSPLVAILGGVGGGALTRLLERAGFEPADSALGLTFLGGVTALASRGTVRALASGFAAAGLSELARSWVQRLAGRASEVDLRSPESIEAAVEAAFLRAARKLGRIRAAPGKPGGGGTESTPSERPAQAQSAPPRRPARVEPAPAEPTANAPPAPAAAEAMPEAIGRQPGSPRPQEDTRPLVIKEPIGAIRFGRGPEGGPAGRAGAVRHPLDAAPESTGR